MSYFHAINGQGGSPEPTPSNDHPPVLLWTNPSPNSTFAGQKVSLDFTQYTGAIINFTNNDAIDNKITSRVYVKKNDITQGEYFGGGYCTTIGLARNITAFDNSGITFGDAYSSQVVNTILVPYEIYGVQEYVVEENAGSNIYYLGTGTSFDIKTLVPDVDYAKLTSDNFIVGCNTSSLTPRENQRPGNVDNEWVQAGISSVNKSYDNSTGVLSLSGGKLSVAGGGVLSVYNKELQLPIFAYIVIGNIVTI